jgi:hypothetical protein
MIKKYFFWSTILTVILMFSTSASALALCPSPSYSCGACIIDNTCGSNGVCGDTCYYGGGGSFSCYMLSCGFCFADSSKPTCTYSTENHPVLGYICNYGGTATCGNDGWSCLGRNICELCNGHKTKSCSNSGCSSTSRCIKGYCGAECAVDSDCSSNDCDTTSCMCMSPSAVTYNLRAYYDGSNVGGGSVCVYRNGGNPQCSSGSLVVATVYPGDSVYVTATAYTNYQLISISGQVCLGSTCNQISQSYSPTSTWTVMAGTSGYFNGNFHYTGGGGGGGGDVCDPIEAGCAMDQAACVNGCINTYGATGGTVTYDGSGMCQVYAGMEYLCTCTFNGKTCPGGTCNNGVCVPTPTCNDSDGGQNYQVAGTCTDSSSHTDVCSGTDNVIEYSCYGSSCAQTTYNCKNIGPTWRCGYGRCYDVPCTPNWSCTNWGTCTGGIQTRTCTDLNNCGTSTGKPAESQSCTVCTCTPGQTQTQSCTRCSGSLYCTNAVQTRTCNSDCVSWSGWSSCTGGTCSCVSGQCGAACSTGQTQSQSCTYCNGQSLCTGSQSRYCSSSCQWGSYGSCTGGSCSCVAGQCGVSGCTCTSGQTQSQSCTYCSGTNYCSGGTQTRTCNSGVWGSWSSCSGGSCSCIVGQCGTSTCGNCVPGQTQSQSCNYCSGTNYCTGGTQTRTCDSSGNWGSYGSCSSGSCSCVAGQCGATSSTCGNTISVSASPSSIPADGSSAATLRASLANGASGVSVSFSTTLGTLSPSSCTTSGGICTVALRSSSTGTATVTSSASGYTAGTTTVSFTSSCTPNCAGKNCGSDGCGGSCGTCSSGYWCDNGVCTLSCTPATCFSLGKNCGYWYDGCSVNLYCGSCSFGYTCNNGVCGYCNACNSDSDCGSTTYGSCGSFSDVCDESGTMSVTTPDCADNNGDNCNECSFPISYTSCSRSTAGVDCGLCSICSGGTCSGVPADDSNCGTIDCDGLDNVCRNYFDLDGTNAGRCEGLGNCKDANSEDCTSYLDLDGTLCGTQDCDNLDGCDVNNPNIFNDYHDCNFLCSGGSCPTSCTCGLESPDCSQAGNWDGDSIECNCNCNGYDIEEDVNNGNTCSDGKDNDCDGLIDGEEFVCPSNNMRFSGNLHYSTGNPVVNSRIEVRIKNNALSFEKITYGETDSSGHFVVTVPNLPTALMDEDFDLAFYVEGEVDAIYECHYRTSNGKCD